MRQRTDGGFFGWGDNLTARPLAGIVTTGGFLLARRTHWRNTFKTAAWGWMRPAPAGTLVHVWLLPNPLGLALLIYLAVALVDNWRNLRADSLVLLAVFVGVGLLLTWGDGGVLVPVLDEALHHPEETAQSGQPVSF